MTSAEALPDGSFGRVSGVWVDGLRGAYRDVSKAWPDETYATLPNDGQVSFGANHRDPGAREVKWFELLKQGSRRVGAAARSFRSRRRTLQRSPPPNGRRLWPSRAGVPGKHASKIASCASSSADSLLRWTTVPRALTPPLRCRVKWLRMVLSSTCTTKRVSWLRACSRAWRGHTQTLSRLQ